MSFKLNLIVFSILFLSICARGFSQNHPDIRTRDVIYLKDGRVLKGEIFEIDESDGKIIFASKNGKIIEIKRIEYEYCIEDERLNMKFSDTLVINTEKRMILSSLLVCQPMFLKLMVSQAQIMMYS
ncbi:MAG: hypothetical protein P8I55_03095 [Crocinitomix sp.]|nr:hypothetical protein [Crocinitomix sp.]